MCVGCLCVESGSVVIRWFLLRRAARRRYCFDPSDERSARTIELLQSVGEIRESLRKTVMADVLRTCSERLHQIAISAHSLPLAACVHVVQLLGSGSGARCPRRANWTRLVG